MVSRAFVQRDAFEWVSRLMAKFSPNSSAAREKSLDKVHWAAPTGGFLYTMEGEHPKHVGAARQNVARHFVPRTAIRSARIGRASSTGAGGALVTAAPPSAHRAAASAPRVLEPLLPQALELLCKGQAANIDGLRLGDALKQLGIVSEEEVQAAITLQNQRRDGRRIGAILMEMKQLKEETIQQALLHRLGVPFVILRKLKANRGVVARLDRAESLARACAVLHETENTVYLAMANPMDAETIKACRFRLEKRIEIVIADRADIAAFLLRHRVQSSQGLSPDYFYD